MLTASDLLTHNAIVLIFRWFWLGDEYGYLGVLSKQQRPVLGGELYKLDVYCAVHGTQAFFLLFLLHLYTYPKYDGI